MSRKASIRIGVVGLGYWGPNLARNFDDLADLAWVCDLSEDARSRFAARYPSARATADYAEMLADPSLDAVVVSTPVPTHYALTKQALEAGKHVLVEKPPALRSDDAEELCVLAEERGLVLMPGHLLLYHPGVQKLRQLVRSGELGDVLCIYGNRQNLGKIRRDENALWSLGVHDLSVILYLIEEEPSEVVAHGHAFLTEGVEDVVFCFLRFPSGKIAHMHLSWLDPHKMRRITVVGRDKMVVFDDMELERKVTIYEKALAAGRELRRMAHADGRHLQPQGSERRAAPPRVPALRLARGRRRRTFSRGAGRPHRRARARAAAALARASACVRHEVGQNVVIYPGTVIGEGCRIGDNAVLGKQPTLSPRSTAPREPQPPLELGEGSTVATGATIFAGTRIGRRVTVGDGACVRERCVVGDDVVIGMGSLVENDTTIGALTKIQAQAYITAYSTLEDNVFIAPRVATTNDNFMGRTERRRALIKRAPRSVVARVSAGRRCCCPAS